MLAKNQIKVNCTLIKNRRQCHDFDLLKLGSSVKSTYFSEFFKSTLID